MFSAIEKGLCQYGVIPLENSTAGSVNEVYDLMMRHNFHIVRSVRLKVDHNLLVKPGAQLSGYKGDILPRAGHKPVRRIPAEVPPG
ncbi:MAG: prephenate dehydratase domain-containing protein [Oscillospiraceae bacterium]